MLYEYLKREMLKHPYQTISDESLTITYLDLLNYAETFGKTLTEQKYGILCKSELTTVKALFACLYAQKIAVLMSERYGELHNKKIIETACLSYLITDNGVQKIREDVPETEDLTDVALIMCTSGTTGTPKGAMITEENLLTNLEDISKYFAIDTSDHILIARPLYHCAVLTGEFFISLIKGLKITFLSDGFVPVNILKCAKEKGITVLCGTPTLMYHLSVMNVRSSASLNLRIIAVSGECMTKTAAKKIRQAFPHTDIYNVYGLTEASPRVCYLPPEHFDEHPLSVGVPLASLKAKIEGDELLISGNSIMKGYYKNPEVTSKVLKDGWLHTGDIAEMDEAGRITIKCRKDNMIIRSGMNIYPQEIESALKVNKHILDVMAFGNKEDTVSEKIHLHVVTELSKSEVYAICKSNLPSFQLPDVIEIVSEIPKNASGKILRPKR